MTEQKLYHPVNLNTADLIISFASKQHAFKLMMSTLREIEEQIELRQKANKKFCQTSVVIQDIYHKEIDTYKQLLHSITGDIKYLENDIYRLNNQRTTLKEELDTYEQELAQLREYAEQRRNKKAKREKQYHSFYNVPIVAAQYKKKYMRARDKNSDAEEQLSKVRITVDSCQKAVAEVARSISDCQKKIELLEQQQQDTENRIKQANDMISELQDGQRFWSDFDNNQLSTALKATQQFIEAIQKYSRKSHSNLSQVVHHQTDFVKVFRLALHEYSEAEGYAESRWKDIQVAFNCARCKTTQIGWPNLDKVRTTDLLCDPCYKEVRTTMILEKKINGVIGSNRSQQLLSLPGSSSFSVSSSNTSNSTTSSNKSKTGFKKMFQMIKNNKRSSSSHDLSSHSPDVYVS
ncbi:uncharacterized protein RHIMIDRAFT_245385 [Rhizopus microsporus ATCC 52813]|uniref:Uncharacterized protein n=2 Tax=Rhizopus microsporus TaxID=58291 RepID=A0A2G4SNF0_RHIZD|nr:uncharacterized protein RHIMIDRAFT_245385 [Rhizopus microsporus ATCC 52813]PHZ10272.1 hypothetical protein RHIMIDRAFT_245385 [Rhizopus microsporus ATCC 52813]